MNTIYTLYHQNSRKDSRLTDSFVSVQYLESIKILYS